MSPPRRHRRRAAIITASELWTTVTGLHISQLYVAHCHSLPASQSARMARLAAEDTDGRRGSELCASTD